MKTIIIATDFSPVAANAAKYGISMAGAIDAAVIIFHAHNMPDTIGEVPVALAPAEEIKNATERKLDALKAEMETIAPGKVQIDTMTSLGDTTNNLQELCDKIKPFAIVMGTHSVTGIEKIFFGSTTLKVIHHSTWPVISVPPGKQFGDGIKKIGFACDLRAIAKTTPVKLITEFVKKFHSEFHVLYVDIKSHNLSPETERQSQLLHGELKEINPHFHFIMHDTVEDGINEFAETNNLDLLIAIPKKHKLLENIFRADATKKLVLHSHIPVMCLHE